MTFSERVKNMLAKAGINGEHCVTPLDGGKNNRVFRLAAGGKQFLLKSYFWHPEDPRERLKAEFLFSRFLWERGIRNIPQPVACDAAGQLGLYAFVPGRKLAKGEVAASSVGQALAFFLAINRHRQDAAAGELPLASEACFETAEHIALIGRRLERLKKSEGKEPVDAAMRDFVADRLSPAWGKWTRGVLRAASGTAGERSLSPSDFGFHNALLVGDGTLYFHDFEYAGWDDPCRTVCDFFCQPELSVPASCFEDFAKEVFGFLKNPAGLERTHLLLPVYRIKWCCILLNEFLKAGRDRRRFSAVQTGAKRDKEKQLALAQIYFGNHF